MRFKINEIGADGLSVNVPVTAEWLAAACPELDARPGAHGLAVRGQLTRTGDDFLLRAELRGEIETTCGRCLEPAHVPVAAPLTITFVPTKADHSEAEDPDVVSFGGPEIDVSDEVRDEIVLALPVQALCTEACRGLCPVCGGNRNQVACNCPTEKPRAGSLGALRDIKL